VTPPWSRHWEDDVGRRGTGVFKWMMGGVSDMKMTGCLFAAMYQRYAIEALLLYETCIGLTRLVISNWRCSHGDVPRLAFSVPCIRLA
jgi:hypothetical protein